MGRRGQGWRGWRRRWRLAEVVGHWMHVQAVLQSQEKTTVLRWFVSQKGFSQRVERTVTPWAAQRTVLRQGKKQGRTWENVRDVSSGLLLFSREVGQASLPWASRVNGRGLPRPLHKRKVKVCKAGQALD